MLLKTTGGELCNVLLEKIISLVFDELKVTFQIFAQAEIFVKSLLRAAVVMLGSFPTAVRQVSSAKSSPSHSRSLRISLM